MAFLMAMVMIMGLASFEVMAATTVATLAGFNTAVAAGEDIIIDANITGPFTIQAGKTISIDLNGYTLTGKLTNSGTLTINATNGGSMTTASGYVIDNKTGATLTINEGTFYSSINASVIHNYGTATIRGGNFSSSNFIAVKNEEDSTIAISGGTFTGNSGLQNYGTANITGGTFTGTAPNGTAIFAVAYDDYPSSTVISGGTFSGPRGIYIDLDETNTTLVTSNVTVTIEDGIFNATKTFDWNNTASLGSARECRANRVNSLTS